MDSMFSEFEKETLILHNSIGKTQTVEAFVDSDMIYSDAPDIIIEEGDIYERTLPNGTKEYFRVIDVGFYKGFQDISDGYQTKVEKISRSIAEKEMTNLETQRKPHKLFISHSSKDKEYMQLFSEMLEDIGMPDGSFVCTSVPGHGIPGDEKIFEWLREQFLTYDLRVVFALSHNYYQSPASLNEMGAAWVTKSTDTLLLLPGFGFCDIQGCVDPREIGISFEMDDEELKHRLNEFKDTLIKEHNLPSITSARWERHRNKFIESVRDIAASRKVEDKIDDEMPYMPVVGNSDVDKIPLDSAFLLVYAAAFGGQIIKIRVLGAPTQISAGGKQFMADNSLRESARWQEALDTLVEWKWVKSVGSKGEIFELTGTGYNKADWLKEGMQIDTDKEPLEELRQFE